MSQYIEKKICELKNKNNKLIARVSMTRNHMFSLKIDNNILPCFNIIVYDESWLWNLWFVHLNFKSLKKMDNENMMKKLPYINYPNQICEGCILGKHHALDPSIPLPSPLSLSSDFSPSWI